MLVYYGTFYLYMRSDGYEIVREIRLGPLNTYFFILLLVSQLYLVTSLKRSLRISSKPNCPRRQPHLVTALTRVTRAVETRTYGTLQRLLFDLPTNPPQTSTT